MRKLQPKWILGVDQTGAINARGIPKPLPACLLQQTSAGFTAELIHLPSLNSGELKKYVGSFESLLVVVDSVLGFPLELEKKGRTFRDYLLSAGKKTTYGRSAAEQFFQSILDEAGLSPAGSASVPVREIEKKLGANSVFRTRPFQKNIQTGSFRIWSDLGKDSDWFWVMPHEIKEREIGSVPTHARAAICEGYPSFSWFKLFGAKSREPQKLPDWISERFPEVFFSKVQKEEIRQDADLADAVVLALAGYDAFYLNRYRYPEKRDLSWEGWILGAE